jgi:hypothetical protein
LVQQLSFQDPNLLLGIHQLTLMLNLDPFLFKNYFDWIIFDS